jgi:hypothetical protein
MPTCYSYLPKPAIATCHLCDAKFSLGGLWNAFTSTCANCGTTFCQRCGSPFICNPCLQTLSADDRKTVQAIQSKASSTRDIECLSPCIPVVVFSIVMLTMLTANMIDAWGMGGCVFVGLAAIFGPMFAILGSIGIVAKIARKRLKSLFIHP